MRYNLSYIYTYWKCFSIGYHNCQKDVKTDSGKDKFMKRIGLLTSGGDCQALNATMRGIVKGICNYYEEVEIYGFEEGYKGLIYGNYRLLGPKDFSASFVEKRKAGSWLTKKNKTVILMCVKLPPTGSDDIWVLRDGKL